MPWLLRVAALYCACLLVIVAAGYLLVRALIAIAPVTIAIAIAVLLTALLWPVSALLRRLRLPPGLAALGGVLTLLGVIVLAAVVLTRQISKEITDLDETVRTGLRDLREAVVDGPLPVSNEQIDRLGEVARDRLGSASVDPVAGASAAVEGIGAALLALILVFFLLKDGERIWAWVERRFPDRLRPAVGEAGRVGWWTLGRYARGTMVVAAVDAVGIGIALLVIGVPLVVPLMLLVFLGGFVPIVGATVAGAVAVLVALVTGGVLDAVLVLAAVIAVQQLEGNLLEPLIVGRAVRLHPAPVLVAVTAGTFLGGIAGAVIAVPILAVLYRMGVVLARHRAEYRADRSGSAAGPPRPPEATVTGA